ncbi:hypothetical protein CGCF415_v000549 [Colletotrichum fructicola]|nr:hypothetical protein CGCF415_v000549 [Colletotrichum fructicola]KAF4940334.1 hypothetical protein CGCF245_v002711 [Colletotrichum fructicola]
MLAAAVSLLIQRANSKRLDWTLDRRSQEARYLTQKQNILAPFISKARYEGLPVRQIHIELLVPHILP